MDGKIIGRGHNQRIQKGSPILHAEMDCFENAGRLTALEYQRCTLYSTLSPCDMCSGTSILYKIPKIIVGENVTFKGPEEYLRSRGIEYNDKRRLRATFGNKPINDDKTKLIYHHMLLSTYFHHTHSLFHNKYVKIEILAIPECVILMKEYIEENPALWNEDIGEK
eukprot:Awhi_evm1s14187